MHTATLNRRFYWTSGLGHSRKTVLEFELLKQQITQLDEELPAYRDE